MRHRNNQGFSLIELIIVIAIIGIVAAIAIPNLIAARRASNESAVVQNLRTITSAQATYRMTYGIQTGGYGSLTTLHSTGALLDSVLANADTTPKGGYLYSVTPLPPSGDDSPGYIAGARPVDGIGKKRFLTDEFGVIYYDSDVTQPLPVSGRASGTPVGK